MEDTRSTIGLFTFLSLIYSFFIGRVQAFVVRGSYIYPFQRSPSVAKYHPPSRLQMTMEPIAALLVAADGAQSLSDFVAPAPVYIIGSTSDLASSAADVAPSAQASIGEAFGSIGHTWSSIMDSATSSKNQVRGLLLNTLVNTLVPMPRPPVQATEATLGSIEALKTQVDAMGQTLVSPFQRFSEYLLTSVTGGFGSLMDGAHNVMDGAQTQLGQSVSENIGNPIEEELMRILARFGTSPEVLLEEKESITSGVYETIQGLEKVATPSTLFYAENAAILPFWAGMIIWPEKPLTKAVMSTYAPVIAASVVYLWLTYESFQNPVALQGFASGITNLGGLTKGFGEEVSVATAWSHFLAEDIFIGRWVYLDGQRNGIFNKHSLALCYLFGPAGFLSHLLTRTVFIIVKPNVRDIEEFSAPQQLKATSKTSAPAAPTPAAGDKTEKIIANARREADAIIKQARSEGEAQAASLLEAAETEALDILKGAEVERSALLKLNKPLYFTSAGNDDIDDIGVEAVAKAEAKRAEDMEGK